MRILRHYRRHLLAIAFGVAYGIFIRLLYLPHPAPGSHALGPSSPLFPTDLWVMTTGFLIVVPFVMGWLTIAETSSDREFHWVRWIFLPWAAVLLADLGLLLALVEGLICLVFAIPITLFVSSIGGISAGFFHRRKYLHSRTTTACLAVVPLLVSFLEMRVAPSLEVRTVETSITIHASVESVWKNIKSVPAIRPSEIKPNWTHRIGFPLPVEATLDRDGIGGIRHATFQGGLLFIETIDRWEPNHVIAFSIAADTEHIPPGTLDDHVTIGGRYFDVLNGEYRLEPMPDGSILLHLSSQERLSTDFNAYAALWTDAVMRNLQQSILEVVKHRCETVAEPVSANVNP